MSAFGLEGLGAAQAVAIDAYTSAYRISGTIRTRFRRVTEILNQLSGTHLAVEQATIGEYDDPSSPIVAPSVLLAVDEVLVMIATGLEGETSGEMRIPKRPVRAQLILPPLRVSGLIHVAVGSRPVDGLLNVPERFIAMTDAVLSSAGHPGLERSASVLALRRDRAHLLLVEDDERPDELLADVLDETTAESWLRGGEEPGA